jgi:hypothetical protein
VEPLPLPNSKRRSSELSKGVKSAEQLLMQPLTLKRWDATSVSDDSMLIEATTKSENCKGDGNDNDKSHKLALLQTGGKPQTAEVLL